MIDPYEAAQFFRIYLPLLDFVNRERSVVADWPGPGARHRITPDRAVKIRDVLWADERLWSRFLIENPAELGDDDRAVLKGWEHRLAGEFVVFKHLKKHTVFLGSGGAGYAVHGLNDSLEAILPYPLPIYVRTVLLPYKDRIIYDGLLNHYSAIPGPGIRADLNLSYKRMLDGPGLIQSLPVTREALCDGIAAGNERIVKAFRLALVGAGLGEKMQLQHLERLRDMAEHLYQQNPPQPLVSLDLEFADRYLQQHPDAATTLKRFVRFLERSDRGDPETVFDLQSLRRRSVR